jgi:hypothetical protein
LPSDWDCRSTISRWPASRAVPQFLRLQLIGTDDAHSDPTLPSTLGPLGTCGKKESSAVKQAARKKTHRSHQPNRGRMSWYAASGALTWLDQGKWSISGSRVLHGGYMDPPEFVISEDGGGILTHHRSHTSSTHHRSSLLAVG